MTVAGNTQALFIRTGTSAALRVELVAVQRRWYTPPSRRTWSKQHYRIRTPRPLVDRLDIARELPQKEWWRERRVAPATFFGFPDVTKYGLRGGSLYVEQMDSVTLAVLADKCVSENVWDPDIWTKFSWRAQQLASRTHEPDLCYIFRAFSRADWFDQNLLTTYLGRLHRRLHSFHLPDVAVLLEAFANPRFRLGEYLQKAMLHLGLLLQHRDDAGAEDLARTCAALRKLWPLSPELSREVEAALELLAEALLLCDLTELGASRSIGVMDCYVTWGLFGSERTGKPAAVASADLCWALGRDLRGHLRNHGHEKPDDLAALALSMGVGGLRHEELWEELVESLEHIAHRLSASSVASVAFGVARGLQRPPPSLYENLARKLRQVSEELTPLDCARAAWGFFKAAPSSMAEEVVLRGPIFDRSLQIGLETFDTEALTVLLAGLARAREGMWGVEAAASSVLEVMHSRRGEFTAKQLASLARSLGYLRPEASAVLEAMLDRAVEAANEADADLAPRHIAMLCQGLSAAQAVDTSSASRRLSAILPKAAIALELGPAALTTAELLGSLAVACPATADRDDVLSKCASHLTTVARTLPATSLVNLAGALSALAGETPPWSAPQSLLDEIAVQLDIKRYDLAPGVLWKAARALEVAGLSSGSLALESRDMPLTKHD